VRDFLDRTGELPPWARPAEIRLGSAFFEAHAPQISVMLACYALPLCYAGPSVARELRRTGQLRSAHLRRVLDAAQMVGEVMVGAGLLPGGSGVAAAQKVRLRDAVVRHLLRTGPEGWNAALGEPLSQEDKVGALLCFSYGVLDGLKKLGIPASEEEAEAYLHTWNVAGHLMGVRDDLLPRDLADAEALWDALARRRFAPSPEGRELIAALVEMMEDIVPGDPLDGLPGAMMRHLMGDALADTLGVPPADRPRGAIGTHEMWRILDGSPLVAQIARRAARTYLGSIAPPRSSKRPRSLYQPVSERSPESPPISA
jgi:hypothetical protein